MVGYIIKRILWTIPVLLFAIAITFLLIKAVPGDPIAHQIQGQPQSLTNALKHKYYLDQPLWKQYVHYVDRLFVHDDWGLSTQDRTRTIREELAQAFPQSLKLALSAFLVAMVIGIPAGIVSALRANRASDYVLTTITTLMFAVPTFVTCTLWYFFFPTWSGWNTWHNRVGPILMLGIALVAYFTRLLRASMLETLQQEYVTTARAKGLPGRITLFRHVIRNSLGPLITNAGPLLGYTITGAFVTEFIFAIPGVANSYVTSIFNGDVNLILGTTVALTILIILLNLLVDIVLAFLDPRIAHE